MTQVNVRKDLTNNLYMQIGREMFFRSTIIYWASATGFRQCSRNQEQKNPHTCDTYSSDFYSFIVHLSELKKKIIARNQLKNS